METNVNLRGIASVLILLLVLLSFLAGMAIGWKAKPEPETKTETKVEYKTIYVDSPIPSVQRTLPDRYFFIPVTDTLTVHRHDTTYIRVPVEQKEYAGEHYRAWVSGYRPQLDSIHITYPVVTNTVTNTFTRVAKPRWSVGIIGGYGFGANGPSPYIGLGLSYNLFSFGER